MNRSNFRLGVTIALATLVLTISSAVLAQETWSINLKSADITQFIDEVAMITGRTFIVDPRVNGEITVLSEQQMDKDQIYNLLLSVLRVHGFGVIEGNNMVRVVQSAVLRTYGGSRDLVEGELSPDLMVSKVIRLTHIDNLELVKILRLISPQYSHSAAIPNSPMVVITDHADNIEGIVNLVETLDVEEEFQTVSRSLKHTEVSVVVEMLEKLMPAQAGESGRNAKINIVANPESNTVVIRSRADLVSQTLEMIAVLDQPATYTGSLRVFRLNYAQATPTADLISKSIFRNAQSGTESGRVNSAEVAVDEDLNALVVRGSPSQLVQVEDLLKQIDIPRPQVLIESAIVEVLVEDSTTTGVELAVGDEGSRSVPTATTSVSGILAGLLAALGTGGEDGDALEITSQDILANTSTPTLAVARLNPDGTSFAAILNALAVSSNSEFLSTPHITALDNAKSKLLVGQNVPIRSGNFVVRNEQDQFPRSSTTRQDIGITLEVTPQIHEDQTVRMEITQTFEQIANTELGIGDAGFADFVTNKSEIATTVVAENRQTIVLGGLIRSEERGSQRKVPGLGNIPFLGRLFRSDTSTKTKRHLLVFLRPTIISSAADIEQTTHHKYDKIWETQIELNAVDQDKEEKVPLEQIYEGSLTQ